MYLFNQEGGLEYILLGRAMVRSFALEIGAKKVGPEAHKC